MNTEPTPTASVVRRRYRVGNWSLEYSSDKPHTIWADPENLKTRIVSSGGIYYGEDYAQKMGWDLPVPPAYVRTAALQIMRGLHNNTTTEGTEQ